MTGLWLISYIILWLLFVVVCLLMVGMLQQLGMLQRLIGPSVSASKEDAKATVPEPENDGPLAGSELPELEIETINGFGLLLLTKANKGRDLLLIFMSALCESCQFAVEPLNEFVDEGKHNVSIAIIMRSDLETCQAFLRLFPLRSPVICDLDRSITKSFNVHGTPFGLVYDANGKLVRRGLVRGQEDLQNLLGSTLESAQT